ncbi:hypothetical protein Ancab_038874 [Ancistrocladus abbreviatus]
MGQNGIVSLFDAMVRSESNYFTCIAVDSVSNIKGVQIKPSKAIDPLLAKSEGGLMEMEMPIDYGIPAGLILESSTQGVGKEWSKLRGKEEVKSLYGAKRSSPCKGKGIALMWRSKRLAPVLEEMSPHVREQEEEP